MNTSPTLTLALHRQGPTVVLEISHTDPRSDAVVAPVRGDVALDVDALRAVQLDPAAYGRALSAQVFHQPELRAHFGTALAVVSSSEQPLRLSIRIDPSAQDLHALRWELLQDPGSGAVLSLSERIVVSRFMVSSDWRPTRVRAKTEMRAVVAVAAPTAAALARAGLAPVDLDGEVARARAALRGVVIRVLGTPEAPCSVEAIVAAVRKDVDILYLVSHGGFARSTGTPTLYFADERGGLALVRGDDLASRLGDLAEGPRLVILASCQSAGDGDAGRPGEGGAAHAALATRIADQGAPAVLAMQGRVSMGTIERLMPIFFEELLRDGRIDRALAVARGAVRGRDDWWMPVLLLRLATGELWYTPDFEDGHGSDMWRQLLKPVQNGKVVPLLGPGMLGPVCGTSFEAARALAERIGFPLAPYEWDDLPRVTQFMSVKDQRYNVVQAYQDQLLEMMLVRHQGTLPPALVKAPRLPALLAEVSRTLRAEDPDDPYRIIAELPASVYITTNFDPLLSLALTDAGRKPTRVLSRWRHNRRPVPIGASLSGISRATPVVYHALGAFGKDLEDTLVLTEDDHFDYLISTASDRLMPPEVESALVDNALLFLGFRLTDWSFRVLFRLIMSLPGKERLENYCHVAVQVDPDLHNMADIQGAKAYLAKYFGDEANVAIFWGTPREFLAQLRDQIRLNGGAAVAAPVDEADDEWDVV